MRTAAILPNVLVMAVLVKAGVFMAVLVKAGVLMAGVLMAGVLMAGVLLMPVRATAQTAQTAVAADAAVPAAAEGGPRVGSAAAELLPPPEPNPSRRRQTPTPRNGPQAPPKRTANSPERTANVARFANVVPTVAARQLASRRVRVFPRLSSVRVGDDGRRGPALGAAPSPVCERLSRRRIP